MSCFRLKDESLILSYSESDKKRIWKKTHLKKDAIENKTLLVVIYYNQYKNTRKTQS